jgi:hypothetical protein
MLEVINMDESMEILTDIKQMFGIQNTVTEFDIDVTSGINTAFFTLNQLGVGPETPFMADEDTIWSDFTTQIPKTLIRSYVHLKTKMVFDPPAASNILEAYKDRIAELEFRMSVVVDNGGGIVVG